VAVPTTDTRFIPDAVARGAAAVIGQPGGHRVRRALYPGETTHARCWLTFPRLFTASRRGVSPLIGVTGTDGKTTTANLIYQILQQAGLRTGIISTVNATIGSDVLDTGLHVTTPEAPDVQRYLARIWGQG